MARKKRDRKQQADIPSPGPPDRQAAIWDAFQKLRVKANHGDPDARHRLIQFMNSNPWLWEKFGNAADHAERSVIEAMTQEEWLTTQCMRHEADAMRKRLLGPSPTPLERVAIERIVATWLQLQHAEMRCAEPPKDLGWAKYWLRRLEVSNKMYSSAVKSLALVREIQLAASEPSRARGTAAMAQSIDLANSHGQLPVQTGGEAVDALAGHRVNGHGANRISSLLAVDSHSDICGDSALRRHNSVNHAKALLENTG